MTNVADVYQLQELDLSLDALHMALSTVEAQIGRDEEIVAARQEAEGLEGRLSSLRNQQHDLELPAETVRSRLETAKKKLYDGSVRNPRELEDMQQDVEMLTRQLRSQEDEVIRLMLQVEETETALRSARTALAEMEVKWRREQDELRSKQASLSDEVARISAQRDLHLPMIDETNIAIYSSLRQRYQGKAVARVERGMCQGCRITLPITVLHRARLGSELVQCPSCERILYVS